ncbi:hypothetical protein CW304_22040 [Bacillus sp. UFRGS-B20]|nr:hypothetical protein CW304_22040 [Bacillus sp. UFRGS-B20]
MFFLENRISKSILTQLNRFFCIKSVLSCILMVYLLFLIFLLFHCRHLFREEVFQSFMKSVLQNLT